MAFSQGIGWGIGKHAIRSSRAILETAFVFTVDTTLGDGLDNYTLNFTGGGYDIETSDGQAITGATTATTINFPGPGTYDIKILGDVSTRTFVNDLKLVDIKNWGVLDTPLDDKFVGANSLTTITAPDQPVNLNMTRLFKNAQNFAGGISHWDVSNIASFQRAFYDTSFDEDISSWDTSSANTFSQMFWGTPFNNGGQPGIGNWDVSNVADFSGCFTGTPFNQPIGSWNIKTSGPVLMGSMFSPTTAFNQDLNAWDVSSVTAMNNMFQNAVSFNQDLNSWNLASVTNMVNMFDNASAFNGNISSWAFPNVTSFVSLLAGASSFNQDISGWDTSGITTMTSMFRNTYAFNQPIGTWDTSSVTKMNGMFFASGFNQNINNWNVSLVDNMNYMFYNEVAFNQPLDNWDVSSVTDMSYMFRGTGSFNQDLSLWNTSNVNNMAGMFANSYAFNQDIGAWDVSQVTSMEAMFINARGFNNGGSSNINNWNTGNVTNMKEMFYHGGIGAAGSFNQPIGNWNTSNVTTMRGMFYYNTAFDQPIGGWDVSNVTDMNTMFYITIIDQDLSNWNIGSIPPNSQNFNWLKRSNYGSPFSTANYDAMLVAYEAQVPPVGLVWDIGDAKYTLGGEVEAARTSLINTYGWTITDGGGIVERNTRIGGIASVYTTPASVAGALGSGVTESDITNFRISGSDVEFDVGVTYTLPSTFKLNTTITAFDDRQGNVIGLTAQAFRSCSAINYLNFPSLTVLPDFTFEGLPNLVSADFISCTAVGGGNNFLANSTATITVALSALTSNADGGPHQSLRVLNCTVDYDGYVDDGTWDTQVDGIAATENTRLLLGNRLGCKTAALLNFQIVGNDVRAKVYGNYSIKASAFKSRTDITDFKDNDNKVTNISKEAFGFTTNYLNATFNGITSLVADNQFRNSAIDTITMNGLTTISGNYLVRDTAVLEFIFPNLINWNTNALFYGNPSLNNIYAPKLETLGTTTGYDGAIANNFANGGTVTVSNVLQTCNGGLPDGDLDYIITNRNANVIYVTPLLLDEYSGAVAAYSLRDLSFASVGNPVVNVRRSSDNATQDFTSTEITDGTLLAFAGNTASDNGYVTTWYDQSGASNNLVQATQANQPKIVSSGVLVERNLKPAVEFDGLASNFLEQSTALSLTEADGFVAVETKNYPPTRVGPLVYNESGLWGYSTSPYSNHYSWSDGSIYETFFTTSQVPIATPAVTLAQLNLYNVLSKSSEYSVFLNSGQIFTTATNTVATSGTQRLGASQDSSNNRYYLDGYVSEFIIYPLDQSANRTGIETNINNHYSIYP